MASLFGITSAKYQYAIDEYYRIKKEVWLIKKVLFSRWICGFVLANLHPDLSVRGKMKRRKTGCRRKRTDRLTRKRWWQTHKRKNRGLVREFPIKSRMKVALLRKPSQFLSLSRQHNGPSRARRYYKKKKKLKTQKTVLFHQAFGFVRNTASGGQHSWIPARTVGVQWYMLSNEAAGCCWNS